MEIKIFERPEALVDITEITGPEISDIWFVRNARHVTVLQQYLNKEINPALPITGLFDQNTFKVLVNAINKRNAVAGAEQVHISFPAVPTDVLAKESGVYLQRVIRNGGGIVIACDGKIGVETITALNKLLCDEVIKITETEIKEEHLSWIE